MRLWERFPRRIACSQQFKPGFGLVMRPWCIFRGVRCPLLCCRCQQYWQRRAALARGASPSASRFRNTRLRSWLAISRCCIVLLFCSARALARQFARDPESRTAGPSVALGSIPDKPNTVCRVARAVGAVPTMCSPLFPSLICSALWGTIRASPTPYPLTSTRSRRIPAATRLSRHDTCRLLIAITTDEQTIVAPVRDEHSTIKRKRQDEQAIVASAPPVPALSA